MFDGPSAGLGEREQVEGGSWRKGSLANSRRKFT